MPSALGSRLVTRIAQFDGDARVMVPLCWRSPLSDRAWPNSHCLLQPLDFARFNLDPALAFRSALEIIDGYRLTANDELPLIRLGKPVVEARDGYSEPSSCFLGW